MPIPDILCTPYTCPALTPGWPTAYSSYREIAYRDFAMSDVQSSCQYQNPNPETPNRAMIYGSDSFLTNGCDYFAKSHFAISEFLMHCVLCIMNSRSPNLRCHLSSALSPHMIRHVLNTATCHSDSLLVCV
jgi:hypothetical protein